MSEWLRPGGTGRSVKRIFRMAIFADALSERQSRSPFFASQPLRFTLPAVNASGDTSISL